MTLPPPVGVLLRRWRERRRLSQLDLAELAEISPRHVSCLETGRSMPSRAMVLRLAKRLDVPLRERNTLLLAAGLAPIYRERRLDDPALRQARAAVERVLAAHEPYPALAVDRGWTLLAANRAVGALLAGVSAALMEPPVNVLRLSLHPDGLAPRITNLGEWRSHVLERLRHQIEVSGDRVLEQLLAELESYPGGEEHTLDPADPGVFVPMRLRIDAGELALISTTTVFGTPVDITLAELAIESFFPADDATAGILRGSSG